MKIFFSYGRDHYKNFVEKIKNDLVTKYNLNIWIDAVELKTADPIGWERSIEEGIEQCDKVIFFLTPHSTRRPDGYCEKEIRYTNIFKKPIIPVMIEKTTPFISICTIQYADIQNVANNFDPNNLEFTNKNFEEQYYEKLEEIYKVLHNELTFKSSDDEIKLLDYIMPIDFTQDISKHLKNFIGREWLYKKVDEILVDNENRVLWITAEAGFGKTAFSTYLQHQHENAIGIYYCKYDSPNRKNPKNVLTTLIYQISTQVPEYKEILNNKQFENRFKDLKDSKYDTNDILDQFLIQPLNKININKKHFFIIDALDEFQENDKNQLADLIPKFDDLPSWLKIVVTSRPEPYLKRKLSMLKTIELDVHSEQNLDDLRIYIKSYENYKNCEILKDETIKTSLIEKSEGNILYLKEVIDSITKGDIKKEEITDLPSGMTGLYVNMFERYFPDVDEYEDKVMPIFELLCAANEPLSKELISDILDIGKRDFKKNLGLIGSLIEENEENEIYFYHKSLSDWLVDEDLCSDDYFVDINDGQKKLSHFLWDIFKENNFNFFYEGNYEYEIYHLLPKLIDSVNDYIEFKFLLDKYMMKLKENVKFQSDILYSFSYMKIETIFLSKTILKWAFKNSTETDFYYYDLTRWVKAHLYGVLKNINTNSKFLFEIKKSAYDNKFSTYQILYTDILFDLSEYIYITSNKSNILEMTKKLFFEAFYDGRIDDINGSLAVLITVLELEFGYDIDKIIDVTDSISEKVIQIGDWDNWANEIKSIPEFIREKNATK